VRSVRRSLPGGHPTWTRSLPSGPNSYTLPPESEPARSIDASKTPFRLYKHWVHEAGIASPFIAYWPRGIKARNKPVHEPAHVIDIMATCLDVAGASYPRSYRSRDLIPLEGRSLLPLLTAGMYQGHETLFWEHEGNRAVSKGRWKLVSRYPERWDVYDMAMDRTEIDDLSKEHPDMLREMTALYDSRAARCGVVPWDELRKKNKHGISPIVFPAKTMYTSCGDPNGGIRMKEKKSVWQGTLALMVLRALDAMGPQHGYGLARRIEQISDKLLAVNHGTLYPVLLKLEQEGSITSDWGTSDNNRRARYYRITKAGKKQLAAERFHWEQTAGIMARFFALEDGPK
jgi:transcriptional regulator